MTLSSVLGCLAILSIFALEGMATILHIISYVPSSKKVINRCSGLSYSFFLLALLLKIITVKYCSIVECPFDSYFVRPFLHLTPMGVLKNGLESFFCVIGRWILPLVLCKPIFKRIFGSKSANAPLP